MGRILIEQPGVYRQSLIAAFDSCPLRGLLTLKDVNRSPGPLAARGTLFHRYVHKAVKEMWDTGNKTMPVELGMEILREVLCQQDVPAEEVVPLTMREMKWIRVCVVKWCESTRLDVGKVISAEQRYYAPIALPTGKMVQITGQLDLLLADPPNGLIVVDYKSGFRRPKDVRDEEKAAREGDGLTDLGWVQWLIYSFLCFQNFPNVDHVIFRERHVLWDQERYARQERWESEKMTDVLAAKVAEMDLAIEEGDDSERWVPSAGTHCSMCPNPKVCPIMEEEDIDLTTKEGRMLVAQEWRVATETRNRRRAILDGIVEQYGPIPIPHADGRRVVGWEIGPDGKRNFKIFEPPTIPKSPFDKELAEAAREAGVMDEARSR